MTVIQRQTFETDGRAIPFIDEGTGPGLVLLPGRGLDVAYLGALASVLEEEGFRVVRIGARRPSDDPVTLHDLARDVVDVMDHLGLQSSWIGGHGFGGAVARTVALDHTGRVDGVLLLAVEGTGSTAPHPDADTPESARQAWGIVERMRDAAVEAAQSAALAATPEAEWTALAPSVPVLVVQGADDHLAPPASGAALQSAAPGLVSVTTIAGAGHLFALTHPGETAMAIEDYLGWD